MFEEEDFGGQQVKEGTLRRIGTFLVPHWKWVVGFLSGIAMVSFLDAFFTLLNKMLIDEGILAGDSNRLVEIITLYLALVIIQAIGVFSFIYLTGILGQRVQYDLRKVMFNHIQELSLSYFSKTPVGWLMARVTSDTERITELVTWGLLDVSWAVFNIATSVIFMLTISWQLTILVLFMIPVLVYVAVWFKKRILIEYRISRKLNSKITASYNENISGVRVVKALTREDANLDEFQTLTGEMYRASYRAAWYSALFLPSVQLITAFAVGGVVLYSGFQFTIAGITIGGITAFIGYITSMMWPVQEAARVYASMQHALASAERSFSLIDTPPEIVNRENARNVDTINGDIVFENVNFYYEKDKPVLKNFSLHVKKGETIALVGPTGAGKSTIVNLVCRFYEPTEGIITMNGEDYMDITLDSIQSKIGVVLQTPHLFSGTIRENIRYGRLDATDEEVEDAAKLAGAHDFISEFESGYAEEVGEGGMLLSVGQKQLISLARAVLAKPEIFVMDEATSSVDTLTEDLIQRGMDILMEGRTSFVIAHRLSTIKRADRIIVIQDGQIEEMGSHSELLRQGGHYYNLYTQQFREQKSSEYETEGVPA